MPVEFEGTKSQVGYRLSVLSVLIVVLLCCALYGCPQYFVWTSSLDGKAQLQKAEYTRQIASLDAQAEITRAEGVAKANAIVAQGLGGPEGYLRYLWIEKVAGSRNQLVYVPAEGGLPILEAGRLQNQSKTKE